MNLKVNNFLIPTIYLVLLGCNWSRCRTCITSHRYKSWIQSYCAQLLHTKVIWLLIGFIRKRWMGWQFVTWCVYTKLNVEANCCRIKDESCNKKRDDCHCIYKEKIGVKVTMDCVASWRDLNLFLELNPIKRILFQMKKWELEFVICLSYLNCCVAYPSNNLMPNSSKS